MHYIYKITIISNGKIYIGQTKDISTRWAQHKIEARKDEPSMTINDAMKKYGIENCKIEVIDFAQNYWQADCLEQNYIKQYDSHIKNGKGYNVSLGGPVAPKSEEWKAQMSAIKGGWIDRKHTEENLEKNRRAHLGTIASEESKQKMSKTMKQKCADGWIQANRAELSALGVAARAGKPSPKKGMKSSEETKKKISEAGKGRTPWNKKDLSIEQVNEIKKLFLEGYSLHKIMKITGIDSRIIKRNLLLI